MDQIKIGKFISLKMKNMRNIEHCGTNFEKKVFQSIYLCTSVTYV